MRSRAVLTAVRCWALQKTRSWTWSVHRTESVSQWSVVNC